MLTVPVASLLHNYGLLLRNYRRHSEAIPIFRRAHNIWRQQGQQNLLGAVAEVAVAGG